MLIDRIDENEMANVIYDTLMENKEFSQFEDLDIENPELTTGNNRKPTITFCCDEYEFRVTIERK